MVGNFEVNKMDRFQKNFNLCFQRASSAGVNRTRFHEEVFCVQQEHAL
jgi:hypothetical protein